MWIWSGTHSRSGKIGTHHMSSLKMGLDQAVLQGFKNDTSKGNGAMT